MAKAKAKAKTTGVSRMPSEKQRDAEERQWRAESTMMDAVKKMPAFKAGVRKMMASMTQAEKDAMKKMKGMM